jgi:hypothetical protein
MNILLETLFISVYSLVLYSILQFVIKKPFIYVLFILGVLKHALGYFSRLQSYYCQLYAGPSYLADFPTGADVFIEGLLYILIGMAFLRVTKNRYIIAFMTGAVLHLGFEWIGLHAMFVKNRCIYPVR